MSQGNVTRQRTLARSSWVVGAVLGAVAALGACRSSSTGPLICTANFVYAITVAVRDSATGTPAATGALLVGTGHAGSSTWTDTGEGAPDSLHLNVLGLAGTYDLTITKPGYAAWSKNGVVVVSNDGGCHPATVALDGYPHAVP